MRTSPFHRFHQFLPPVFQYDLSTSLRKLSSTLAKQTVEKALVLVSVHFPWNVNTLGLYILF